MSCHGSARIVVSAGPHDRQNCLVTAPCPQPSCKCGSGGAGAHKVVMLDEAGNPAQEVASQCIPTPDGWRIAFIVPKLEAGKTAQFELLPEKPEIQAGRISVQHTEGKKVDFLVADELFTSYVYRPDNAPRPYCYPVHGPGGALVTNFAPSDHVHHKSIWIAHGEVNGNDNWSEAEGHARTVNTSLEVLATGPLAAVVRAEADWVSAKDQKLMKEIATITVWDLGDDVRVMDWHIVWRAEYGGVFLGDTKEAGTISVRVAESMEEKRGGRIVNAYGACTEAECWGRRAPWVDYCGPVDGETYGIAIFDHPSNPRHPTHWHVRAYGLFTANQWGLHNFYGDWSVRGDLALPQGQQIEFNFRILIHLGDTQQAQVARAYIDWAYPPSAQFAE